MPPERTDLEKVPPQSVDIPAQETAPTRPHYPPSYGYGHGGDAQKIYLREVWRTLRKRKWLIASIAFIITIIATVEVYRTKSIYQATTLVEIGKETTSLSRPDSIWGEDFDPFYMVNIKTKILTLRSRALMEAVVKQERFDQDPRFLQSGDKKSVWQALKSISGRLGLGDRESADAPKAEPAIPLSGDSEQPSDEQKQRIEACVGVLAGGLGVEPVPETRALSVSFVHTDPKIAAQSANAIAKTFVERNFENKTEKFRGAAKWLDDSANRLKAKVEESEQALADYTRAHGIFSTDKEGTLTTAKLSSLHDQALRASSDRMLKQSLYEEVKEHRIEKLPEAYAEMLFKASPKTAELQKQLSDLQTQSAELGLKYGPDNPRVLQVREKMSAIKSQIDESSKSLGEKVKTEYERAVRDENMLQSALAQAKKEALQQNQDAIQYNILKQDVETNRSLYHEYLQKTNQAQAQVVEQQNNLRVIEAASVPGGPIGPRRGLAIMVALMLSTAAGIGLAFLLEYLDNTIKTVEDVGRYTQLPALSVVPAVAGSPARRIVARGRKALGVSSAEAESLTELATLNNHSSAAEAYRVLRTSVLLSAAGGPPRSILVTSGQPGEGKTTTVVNTAISLAQTGASVLIVDCDLRRPMTHKILGVDQTDGLATYLSREVPLDELIHKLPIANLSLLPCGPVPPNPAELLISEKMKSMLRDLSGRYDHVLIDSSPLMNVTDPVILSTMVDGVILVVHGGKSTRDVVQRARHELSNVGAKIFGVVLNNVDVRRGYDDYYYYRYYSDYAKEDSAEMRSPSSKGFSP